MKQACLLTGVPGVGKTSLIREVVSEAGISAGGFYTEEIRISGLRQGFRIMTLDGRSSILAHINVPSPYRVSKYGVDIKSLEEIGVSAIKEAIRQAQVVVVDEIGKMELFSPLFREAVREALESSKPLLGTIMLVPHPWADILKSDPRVEIMELTRANCQQVKQRLLIWLKSLAGDS